MKPLLSLIAIVMICGQIEAADLERLIVGKWKSTNHPGKWEFFKDGSVTGGHNLAPETGNWKTVDATHIRINWPNQDYVYEVKAISTNTPNVLSLTTPAGKVWAFRRL